MKAMVIDDSRAIRIVLRRILAEIGFEEIYEAGDGVEALAQLELTPELDLALVDWNMPHMNGFEFVKAVRADPGYDAVRLMMVTTETEMEQVVRAIEAGANEYVMKPFTKEMILEKLDLIGIAPRA